MASVLGISTTLVSIGVELFPKRRRFSFSKLFDDEDNEDDEEEEFDEDLRCRKRDLLFEDDDDDSRVELGLLDILLVDFIVLGGELGEYSIFCTRLRLLDKISETFSK